MRGEWGKIEGLEQIEVLVFPGIGRGQQFIPVEDRIRPREKAEGLPFLGQRGAPGRKTDFGHRQNKARGGDKADQFEDVHRLRGLQRRAFDRDETIDRHALRRRVESGENLEHAQAVFHRFTHAKDASATNLHPGALHRANGVEAVLKGVGADNLRIILRRRVNVVIVSGHPRLLELPRRIVAELAERHANFHPELADLPHRLEHGFETTIARADPFPGRTHTKAGRSIFFRSPRMGQDFLRGHERLRLEVGVVMRTLRAVTAILAASPRLDAQQRAKLHFASRPMALMDPTRFRDEVEKRAVVDFLELRVRLFHCAGA